VLRTTVVPTVSAERAQSKAVSFRLLAALRVA